MMKKIAAVLFTVLAVCSCEMKDVFTLSNQRAFVSVKDGHLTDDYGFPLNIVESNVKEEDWNTEGSRWFITYDVLNRQFDLRLNTVEACTVVLPESGTVETTGDPVIPGENAISGGYFNIRLEHYAKKGSTYPRQMHLYCEVDDTRGTISFRLYNDGGGENPAAVSEKDLEKVCVSYSFPLKDLVTPGKRYSATFTWDRLYYSAEGSIEIVETTTALSGTILFPAQASL